MAKKKVMEKNIKNDIEKDIKFSKYHDSFFNKLQGSLIYPGKFFSNLKEKTIWPSYSFFIIVSLIYFIISSVMDYFKAKPISLGLYITTVVLAAIIILILVSFILLAETLILYVFILIFKVKLDFSSTFRLKAYTSSPLIFAWVHPLLGIIISSIWSIIIEIIGLSSYANISKTKSAIIVLLPILIVLFLVLLFIVLFLSVLLSSPIGFLIKDFV